MTRTIMEERTVEVESLAAEGDAVAHDAGGLTLFIPYGAPGDRLRVGIEERHARWARARILEMADPSPQRVAPPCPVFGRCGGCTWQHVAYEAQLAAKRRLVRDALERIGHLGGVEVEATLPSPSPWRYRNKAAVPLGRGPEGELQAGFYQRETHRIVPFVDCVAEHPLIDRVVASFLEVARERGLEGYDERSGRGLLRHLVVRVAPRAGRALAAVVVAAAAWPEGAAVAGELMRRVPELEGVVASAHPRPGNAVWGEREWTLAGRPELEEPMEVPGWGRLRFRVAARSFFQVNEAQAERLYALALDGAGLGPGDRVVDLYTGVGTLALFAALRARRVTGIEEVAAAVEDARQNAERNGLGHVRFLRGKAERLLPRLVAGGEPVDVLLLDPPRKGAAPEVLAAIRRAAPRRVVYVSCNPATLARDLALLAGAGEGASYRVERVAPVDLFPQTAHVEAVAWLARNA
ncbi:MAG: 23S rRNA (uracil(1939)-C(5))-methyltransferase RlmD [Bacillota bacterium]|nr:23S rRNA (uracil(1939)-C(5))-methyltransferase RlmD [Bacillota bacterium]